MGKHEVKSVPSLLRKGNLSWRSGPCLLFIRTGLLSGCKCAVLVLSNGPNPSIFCSIAIDTVDSRLTKLIGTVSSLDNEKFG